MRLLQNFFLVWLVEKTKMDFLNDYIAVTFNY